MTSSDHVYFANPFIHPLKIPDTIEPISAPCIYEYADPEKDIVRFVIQRGQLIKPRFARYEVYSIGRFHWFAVHEMG